MKRNPINKRTSIPKARANWSSRIAVTILLLALVLYGKPPAAQTRQAETPARRDAAAQARPVPSRITQAVDETRLSSLRGNTHPLARAEFARGAAPPSLSMERMLLVLKRSPEQETALQKLLDEQQDMSSPNYHNWLTPEQFGLQFGASDADIQTITFWLQSHGFRVAQVSRGRTVIEFSGTAAQVQEAFHTAINRYVVNGKEHWANANDPQIPTALTPVVQGPVSLHNFPRKPLHHAAGAFSRSKETGQVTPLFTDTGHYLPQSYALGPTDFATIYNVSPLWNASTSIDGTGQTIAIVGQSNIVVEDVRDFRNFFGLPAMDPVITLDGPDPGIVSGDEDESILDVEWAGAVAKGATINLVVSESTISTQGVDLSAIYIVDNNLAPVLSESYGDCELDLGTVGNAFYSDLWGQAAAQGITVLVASGDAGSAACDTLSGETAALYGLAVNGIASTPFNVAVGGTDFNDANNPLTYWNPTNNPGTRDSAKSYIPETTWNNSCAASGLSGCTSVFSSSLNLVAAGGGPSNCVASNGVSPSTCSGGYSKPSWQTGLGDNVRDIPDLSLFSGSGKSNNNFYVVCQADQIPAGQSPSCSSTGSFSFTGAGGTSTSAQAFAGIMALVNQQTGSRQGNANYMLYKLAASNASGCDSSTTPLTNSSCTFYDVTKGNISVACAGGSLNCSKTTSGGFGVLVSPSTSTTPAWTTAAGYDLATG
ncbi:MAG: S53 family peptidase, partial [Acidobacteriota bacterium]